MHESPFQVLLRQLSDVHEREVQNLRDTVLRLEHDSEISRENPEPPSSAAPPSIANATRPGSRPNTEGVDIDFPSPCNRPNKQGGGADCDRLGSRPIKEISGTDCGRLGRAHKQESIGTLGSTPKSVLSDGDRIRRKPHKQGSPVEKGSLSPERGPLLISHPSDTNFAIMLPEPQGQKSSAKSVALEEESPLNKLVRCSGKNRTSEFAMAKISTCAHAFLRGKYKLREEWSRYSIATRVTRNGVMVTDRGSNKSRSSEVSSDDGNAKPCLDRVLSRFVIDPDSQAKMLWNLFSFILLMLDIVTVPLVFFMDMPESNFTIVMGWVVRVFWTVDIPLSFCTGIYVKAAIEMTPSVIGKAYLQSWFPADVSLVATDWLQAVVSVKQAELLPMLRAFRLARVLRLVRVGKLSELNVILNNLLVVLPDSAILAIRLARIIFGSFSLIHVLACIWYAVGRVSGDGWAHKTHVANMPLSERYVVAYHWMVTQMSGTSAIQPGTVLELVCAILMMGLALTATAVLFAQVSYALATLRDDRAAEMQHRCRQYLRTREVSARLQMRLNRYLNKVHNTQDFKETVTREHELISSFPRQFQIDLCEELRKPILSCIGIFSELNARDSFAVRKICFEAVSCETVCISDVVFLKGDIATRLLSLESGTYAYQLDQGVQLPSKRRNSESGFVAHYRRGDHACEAAFWTQWTALGNLTAKTNGTYFAVDLEVFHRVVLQQDSLMQFAVAYGRHFVINLHELDVLGRLSDFVTIDADAAHNFEINDPQDEHFIFLSHYKEEAGTEAALMAEALKQLILSDDNHVANGLDRPCFLDSSDLSDLSQLKQEVERSHNLLLLLTPSVLTRPWCLIEIVAAQQAGLGIVPVEIQRAGMTFQYPDEQFYASLVRGEGLRDADVQLMQKNGIKMEDVVSAIRQVFEKIVIPFSPHKSATIRQAELEDILARCGFRVLES